LAENFLTATARNLLLRGALEGAVKGIGEGEKGGDSKFGFAWHFFLSAALLSWSMLDRALKGRCALLADLVIEDYKSTHHGGHRPR
jgi:hypothetical protein